eukprot:COSAG01_NODE_55639_length_323_cov_2.008929_1_plen_46_part_10
MMMRRRCLGLVQLVLAATCWHTPGVGAAAGGADGVRRHSAVRQLEM